MVMHVRRVSQNIIRKHGQEGFLKLLSLLHDNTPCTKIAEQFNVTRQRAHQWKQSLGTEKKTFILYPDVEHFVNMASRTRISV
jgi:hypothetical protein